jgi:hypothetical protein
MHGHVNVKKISFEELIISNVHSLTKINVK